MSDGIPRFPSNSIKPRPKTENDDPEIESKKQAITKAKIKPKSLVDRFAGTFFGEDADTVLSYIWGDVLIPAAKNTIVEMVKSGIEMLIFGETLGASRRSGERSRGLIVNYAGAYETRGRDTHAERRIRSRHQFNEVVLQSRSAASAVLEDLRNQIEDYGTASVADFYDLVDIESEYTDHKYGWTDLSRTVIMQVREGYIIDLPRAVQLG